MANGLTPGGLYDIIKPEQENGKQSSLPKTPKAGLGKRILKDLCAEYNLNITEVVQSLAKHGIGAKAEMNIKTIAEENQTSPFDVYNYILTDQKE